MESRDKAAAKQKEERLKNATPPNPMDEAMNKKLREQEEARKQQEIDDKEQEEAVK